jgi:hypothetical protein
MRKSHALRLCAIFAHLGVNALLTGCATAPPTQQLPVVIYDDSYWNARSCVGVEEPVIHNCNAAHARAGLAMAATIPKFTPSREQAAQALDLMLAESLKDPMSAMQYRVSDVKECARMVLSTIERPQERGCLCYSVNAKNSYGGYTGSELSVVRILQPGQGESFIAQPVEKSLFLQSLAACMTEPRDAQAIKALVR